ncbi:hypothetical protein [Anaerosporomusa subterranea]
MTSLATIARLLASRVCNECCMLAVYQLNTLV